MDWEALFFFTFSSGIILPLVVALLALCQKITERTQIDEEKSTEIKTSKSISESLVELQNGREELLRRIYKQESGRKFGTEVQARITNRKSEV